MTNLVPFELESGDSIVVEVVVPDSEEGLIKAGRAGDLAEKASTTFDEALAKLRPIANSVVSTLKDLAPEKVTVEFGIKFSAKSGIILASADSEANLKITIEWKGATEGRPE